jgi:hypothetical protein
MKKLGVLLLALLITMSFFTIASCQNKTMDERAISCLESSVRGKCASLTFEEKVFALLALSGKQDIASECQATLSGECAPVGGPCTIKSTALAALALTQSSAPADNKISWLLSKTIDPNLVWYIEIDAPANTTCKASYLGTEYNMQIKSDGTITIPNNNCLRARSPNPQWLEIDKSCLANTFSVTCSADFVSNTIYKSSASNTIFVSGSIQSSPADGTNTHSIESKCLSETSTCDYPGTLWAAYALMKANKPEYKKLLPYLFAYADDNAKTVPYAFLYAFTAEPEYTQKLLLAQKPEWYWDWSSGRGIFYDTATTLIGLQSQSSIINSVKVYLAQKQGTNGCWQNSIINTGFLMWTLNQKPTTFQSTQLNCKNSGYYCTVEGECSAAGGEQMQNYYCPSSLQICCTKPAILPSCASLGGTVCPANNPCQSPVDSSEGACCVTACGQITPTTTECEDMGYACRGFCNTDEESVSAYACNEGDTCCKPVIKGTSAWVWIILILILAGIGALGYVYREKVKIWYNQLKQKFGRKGPGPASTAMRPRPPYPPAYQPMTARLATHPGTKVSADVEETLRKLREIGK